MTVLLLIPQQRTPEAKKLLTAVGGLGIAIFLSALINGAGIPNVLLDFILLAEPIFLLIAIVNTQWNDSTIRHFKFWISVFVMTHVVLALIQRFGLGLTDDGVQGLFLGMGAGSHVAGAFAVCAASYYLIGYGIRSNWLKWTVIGFLALVVVFSDAKQAVATLLASMGLLFLYRLRNIRSSITYLGAIVLVSGLVYWAATSFFPAYATWANVDLLTEGIVQKLSVFPILVSHYDSIANWFVGLGPGHTVGRLGWLIPEYYSVLEPLGITTSHASVDVFEANQAHYISNSKTGSSFFSLMFSWAGIWGDLGLIGLGAYLFAWAIIWRYICLSDLSRFIVINIFIYGFVFAWLEEPGYMLLVVSLLGLHWQQLNLGNDKTSGSFSQTNTTPS
jgi:hypothetical protein